MKNLRKNDDDCQTDRDIRAAMARANCNGWWQMVSELTVELNHHHKSCPTCNPEISRGLLAELFGGQVEVGR
jgi:hypothetical protein